MPLCHLHTSDDTQGFHSLGQPVPRDRIPDDVVWLEVGSSGTYTRTSYYKISYSYENLSNLMRNTPRRLNEISISSTSNTSPEYLRFVSLTCQKTKSLMFNENIPNNRRLIQCLNFHLVEGGIEEFNFGINDVLHHEMGNPVPFLQQAIPQASSLKKLSIRMNSYSSHGDQLIRALEQNQSLRVLDVYTKSPADEDQSDNRMMQRIFCATIQLTQVSELSLRGFRFDRGEQAGQILDQRVFIDCLCNPSCGIEKLHLDQIKIQRESDPSDEIEARANHLDDQLLEVERGLQEVVHSTRTLGRGHGENLDLRTKDALRAMKACMLAVFAKLDADREASTGSSGVADGPNNSSLKSLDITNAELNSVQLRRILPRFKSLVELDLGGNNLWNISPVKNLLLQSQPSLKMLCLKENHIDEDDIEALLAELPNMASLKSLDLSLNPCVWSGATTGINKQGAAALEHAAMRNTKIERLEYCDIDENFEEYEYIPNEGWDPAEIRKYRSQYNKKKIKAHLAINRGGRAYLQKCTLPLGLWPLILERASKLRYCGWNGSLTETDTRKDAVYWLLREQVLTGSI